MYIQNKSSTIMRWVWHEEKNKRNFRKHGIWFEEAQSIWADIRAVEFFDPDNSESEDRFIRIGLSLNLNLVLVVFCDCDDELTIRIISARKATKKEREEYEKGI